MTLEALPRLSGRRLPCQRLWWYSDRCPSIASRQMWRSGLQWGRSEWKHSIKCMVTKATQKRRRVCVVFLLLLYSILLLNISYNLVNKLLFCWIFFADSRRLLNLGSYSLQQPEDKKLKQLPYNNSKIPF